MWLIPETQVVKVSTVMDARRRRGRCNAEADQQRVGDHSECHAERAVDDLRRDTDSDERQQVDELDRMHLPPFSPDRLITNAALANL